MFSYFIKDYGVKVELLQSPQSSMFPFLFLCSTFHIQIFHEFIKDLRYGSMKFDQMKRR